MSTGTDNKQTSHSLQTINTEITVTHAITKSTFESSLYLLIAFILKLLLFSIVTAFLAYDDALLKNPHCHHFFNTEDTS
jgi:hypothetical protein